MAIRYLSGINVDSNTLFVDSTNNRVGIGTGSPGAQLHVQSSSPELLLYNTTTAGGTLNFVDQAWQSQIVGIQGNLLFKTGGTTERVRITNDGNVGIGTTSPVASLQIGNGTSSTSNRSAVAILSADGGNAVLNALSLVNSRAAANGNGTAINFHNANNYSPTGRIVSVQDSGTNASLRFSVYNSTDDALVERITLLSSGNVGIGTTAPAYKLDVIGQAQFVSGIVTNTGTPVKMIVSGGILNDSTEFRTGNGEFKIYSGRFNAAHQSFVFATGDNYTSGAERMRITSAGNVGIGTTSPSEKLHVVGNANVSGYVYTSTLYVNNTNGTAIVNAYSSGSIGTYLAKASSATANFTTTGVSYPRGLGFGAIIGQGNATDIPVNNASWNGGYGGNIGFWSDVHYGVEGGTNSIGFNAVIKGSGESYSYGFFSDLSGASAGTRYGIYTKGEQQNYFSGNVGIGTVSPISKLEISGPTGSYSSGIGFSATGTGARTYRTYIGTNGYFYFDDATGGSSRLTIDTSGNVGIGTTSPVRKLDVAGGDIILSSNATYIRSKDASGNTPRMFGINPSNDTYIGPIDPYAGGAVFYGVSANVSSQTFYTGASARLHINSAGNVGIGTTSPNGVLTVIGNTFDIRNTGSAYGSSYALEFSTNATIPRIDLVDNSVYTGNFKTSGGLVTLQNSSNNALVLGTNNAERLRITSGGNVGIGTTAPGQSLHVYNGGGNLGYKTARFDSNDTANGTRVLITNSGNTSNRGFALVTGGSGGTGPGANNFSIGYYNADSTFVTQNMLVVTSAGNVGIGTTSPGAKLDVNGDISITVPNANTSLLLKRDVSGTVYTYGSLNNAGSDFNINGTGNVFINADSDSDSTSTDRNVTFGNRGVEYMRVRYDGNVGIGTTAPTYKLNVVTNAVAGKQNFAAIDRTAENFVTFTNPQYSADASMGLMLRVFPQSDSRQGAGIIASGGANNACTDLDLFVTTSPDGLGGTSYSALKISGNTGNVGIGTTSPLTKLDVRGSTYISGYTVGFDTNPQGNYAYRLTNDGGNSFLNVQGGNVGIGTTSPNAQLDAYTTQGGSTIAATHGTGGTYPKASGISFGATSTSLSVSNNGGTVVFTGGAGIYANNGAASNNPTELVFWTTSAGSPAARLTIASTGAATFSSSVTATTFLGDLNGTINTLTTGTTQTAGDNSTLIATTAYADAAAGAVPIGNYLPLAGGTLTGALGGTSATFTGNISAAIGAFNSGTTNVVSTFTSTDGTATLQCVDSVGNVEFGASGNNFVVQPAGGLAQLTVGATTSTFAGNVGIGTTSPGSYKLNVSGTGYYSGQLTVDGFTNNSGISFRDGFDPTNVGIRAKAVGTANRDGLELLGANGIDFTVNNGANVAMRIVGLSGSGMGNVGIGTTSPAYLLDVSGTARILNGIYFNNASGSFLWETGANALRFGTNNTERMRIDASGNVGIGTTSPSDTLDLYQAANTTAIRLTSAGVGSKIYRLTSQLIGVSNAGFGIQNATDGRYELAIDGSGNVGIGNTNPTAKLQVGPEAHPSATGIEVAAGAGGANLLALDSSTNHNWLPFTDGSNYYSAVSHTFRNELHSTDWMKITSAGNVGIGTTAPGTKLDVVGNARMGANTSQQAFAALQVSAGEGTVTTYRDIDLHGAWAAGEGHAITANYSSGVSDIVGQIVFQHDSPGSKIKFGRLFHSGNQSTYPMELVSDGASANLTITGKVGIGTTSPTNPLTVTTATNAVDVLRLNNTGGDSGAVQGVTHLAINHFNGGTNPSTRITAYQDSTSGWPGGMYFSTRSLNTDSAPLERMRITSAGNIGIGTTSPQYLLDVNGDAQINAQGTGPAYAYVPDGGFGVDNLITSGSENVALGKPDVWLRIHVDGVAFVFPGYQEP
jgi:fibronectin-binding autotransporter adhesin